MFYTLDDLKIVSNYLVQLSAFPQSIQKYKMPLPKTSHFCISFQDRDIEDNSLLDRLDDLYHIS